MAQFIGSTKGGRGEATRLGNKVSGIRASANGWKIGITVRGQHSEVIGDDFQAVFDGGSNSSASYGGYVDYRFKGGMRVVEPSACFMRAIPDDHLLELLREDETLRKHLVGVLIMAGGGGD